MSSDWIFPPVPPELKSLAPYFQRAQELRVKDTVMSYWCTYYAAQQGISSKAQGKDTRPFLFQILSILELMKGNLADNDAVTDDEAGAAYIENFALRVFNMADNEDRKEQATRSTAKKFLASANFFELLHIFGKPIEPDTEEKIRYAKWKAADLAKAFREGRKPIPGDANTPLVVPLPQPATTHEPPPDTAPSMSAWSPGTSLAPSPAVQHMQSLEPSPITGAEVPLPPTVSDGSPPEPMQPLASGSPQQLSFSLLRDNVAPGTPSPRSFGRHLNLNRDDDGYVPPGMWSTMATPGTEDEFRATDDMGGISESPSARPETRRKDIPGKNVDEVPEVDPGSDMQDDSWSTTGNQSMSRQNSWTIADIGAIPIAPEGEILPPPPSGIGLGLQPDGIPSVVPIKKVHFSPSVVGGLSSTSSSVAGSSPPGSPGGYAPSLSTVPETTYSSDSERDVAHQDTYMYEVAKHPLCESGSSASEVEVEGPPQGPPPVIHKVSSPVGPLSPNSLSSPRFVPQVPPPALSTHPHIGAPSLPQFPVVSSRQADISPNPPVPPALHPTPRFVATPLATSYRNNHIPPKPPSPPPELTSTQIARIQKHCRFAISALDYEDTETARKELRSALAMLGD